MILKYIKLKNFCPYYDEQIIHFATDKFHNVTVIRGVNGTGKTSLLNALNWCLYGDSFFNGDIDEFVNTYALAQAENVETSVEIGFVNRDIEYRAERKFQLLHNNKTTFSLQEQNGPLDSDTAASDKVQSIIPEDVSAHFFFDGEKIDNFARPGNENEIKKAARNVLRIEVFERGITHLETVAQHYQTDMKKYASDQLKALISDKEEKRETYVNLSQKIEDKHDEIKLAKKQKRDIDLWLEEYIETRHLFEEQTKIKAELKGIKEEKTKGLKQIQQIANDGFIPLAKPVLDSALEILEKNEVSIAIPESILNDLLDQMRCLCGRVIHREGSEYQNIQNLILQTVSSELGNVAKETENSLKRLLADQVRNIPIALKNGLSNDEQLERDIESKEARLDEIRNDLENFDADDFRKYQKAQTNYERELGGLESDLKHLKEKSQDIKALVDTLDEKIKKEKSLETKTERLRHCWNLSKESALAMKETYAPLEENMRRDLEAEVSKIFKKLVWKKKSFSEVRLSENYELQVIDRYDWQASAKISAGEREVLSLAFIAALARVAVKEKLPEIQAEHFPIVMDAPFTKLSDKPKENITETIPDIANQLILFLTDQELKDDEQAWKNLEPRIGAVYQLDFDDEESVTKIKQIQ